MIAGLSCGQTPWRQPMTLAKSPQFRSFDEYLAIDPAELPDGRFEYCDGALTLVMPESLKNGTIATYILLMLIAAGVPFQLIRHNCEVEVSGRPQSRIPDLTVIDELHLTLLKKRVTITRQMPPPQLVIEVVSPGDEDSTNYKRDYEDKRDQYADRGIPEYWLIDPDRAWVMVGTLTPTGYQFTTFQNKTVIISPTFSNLKLTAEQILQAGL
jgi:Uma2 family endonuclease